MGITTASRDMRISWRPGRIQQQLSLPAYTLDKNMTAPLPNVATIAAATWLYLYNESNLAEDIPRSSHMTLMAWLIFFPPRPEEGCLRRRIARPFALPRLKDTFTSSHFALKATRAK
jgi:hypothetical protein